MRPPRNKVCSANRLLSRSLTRLDWTQRTGGRWPEKWRSWSSWSIPTSSDSTRSVVGGMRLYYIGGCGLEVGSWQGRWGMRLYQISGCGLGVEPCQGRYQVSRWGMRLPDQWAWLGGGAMARWIRGMLPSLVLAFSFVHLQSCVSGHGNRAVPLPGHWVCQQGRNIW